jgi:hypothetical protein
VVVVGRGVLLRLAPVVMPLVVHKRLVSATAGQERGEVCGGTGDCGGDHGSSGSRGSSGNTACYGQGQVIDGGAGTGGAIDGVRSHPLFPGRGTGTTS